MSKKIETSDEWITKRSGIKNRHFVSEKETTSDLAYIAAGRLDGFWGNGLKPWDVAAGIVIAEEAGALLSDFNGNPKYHDSENIVCCSPKCFKPILQAVKSNLESKT